ncbi:hypothetical protein DCS_08151 [Drechmeria coniospora]|uniref:Uncharacterized protein n=1 Tax=Drechmeria coniospora TaxID=98403 RepID=A0A151GGH1_DRECN|nr:hypothetical protein DCS_08151 [Drechmeria coniospora]KYK56184.1 hypothetical protein DCS_08151 [Drechmeria coniospora]
MRAAITSSSASSLGTTACAPLCDGEPVGPAEPAEPAGSATVSRHRRRKRPHQHRRQRRRLRLMLRPPPFGRRLASASSSTPRTWTPIKDGLLPTPPGSLRDAVVSEIAKAVGRTLLSALFSRPMAPSSSGRALHHLAQGLFAVLVIAIWVFVWMVQLQAIRLPDWTRDWHEAPADVQTTYAVTLFACVGLIFVLFLAAGLFQMRRRRASTR